jgi:murein DD-endopeptidase MepM/ murein hydrolase activator NlpD
MSAPVYQIPVCGADASNRHVSGQTVMPFEREIFTTLDSTDAEPGTAQPLTIKIRRGQSLSTILNRRGIKASEIAALDQSIKGIFDIRDIKPGRNLRLWLKPNGPSRIVKLSYQIDAGHRLEVKSHQGAFNARKISFTEQASVGGSMAEIPRVDALPSASVMTIPDVLVPDWSTRDAALNFLSAPPHKLGKTSLEPRRKRTAVVRKKMFLKAPLRYKRISSGYSHNRRHPVYHVRRPHLGIDYAAPMGTAVRAVGQGTVVYVGRSGGFGRCVHIRHPYGYTTYYGHLSRFGKGLSVGKHVSQGRVIGYVGMSGVATGPHLDFRVSHKGRFINPIALGKIKKPV